MPALTAANLAAYALQVAAIVAIGAGLPVVLRVASPRARLIYWRALLVVCLVLPLVQPLVPLPSSASPPATTSQIQLATTATSARSAVGEPATPISAPPESWPVGPIAAVVILGGMAARFIWLGVGLVSLRRLRRFAALLLPRPAAIDDACLLTGADAEFRITPAVARPVTFGAARPVVVVPSEFNALGEPQQKAVACHELVHVRRHDWIRTIGDEAVRSVFWFHPALWWLLDQIHLALEQVVDQEVVELTGARQPYLDALLRLAVPAPRMSLRPASLFLRRSHLRERVALLLKEVSMSRPRLVASFLTMAAVLLVSGRLAVSAFPLQGTNPAPVVQPTPAAQAAPVAQPAEAAQAAGAAAPFVGPQAAQAKPPQGSLRPGEPIVKPQVPTAGATVPVKIHDVRPVYPAGAAPTGATGVVILKFSVDAAGLVSDVQVVRGEEPFAGAAVDAVRQWRYGPPKAAPLLVTVALNIVPPDALVSQAKQSLRVGGNIKAPTKIKDVRPMYPEEARQAGVQGVVILELAVDGSGIVTDARVLRSIPMLDAAALDAATQWQFTGLLLNGVPMPVVMTVTVNFKLETTPRIEGVFGGVGGGVAGGVSGGVQGGVVGGVGGGGRGRPAAAGGVSGGAAAGVAGGVATAEAEARGVVGGVAGGQQAPVRVGSKILSPTKTKDVRPVYPDAAKAAGIEGVVIVEIVVGSDGGVQDAKILRSIPALDQAALDAVRQWEFTLTLLNGVPVPVIMTVTVSFKLQ